jgi:hypothetical protein
MTTDALDALFRRLVLAAQEAGAVARPLDVAEVLDTFVPYRAARRDGLLDTNDDYLHCMMQLLAGERGYIFADDLLQDDLKNELAGVNPDLGVLTSYRTAKVRIASTAAQRVLAGDTTIDLRPETPAAAAPASSAAPVAPVATTRASVPAAIPTAPRGVSPLTDVPGAPSMAAAPVEPKVAVPTSAAFAFAEAGTLDCPYCSQALPTAHTLKYCPHCGLNLRIRRCPGCSAEMEAEWKFCVTCGRSAP